jgi:hypothetical protein
MSGETREKPLLEKRVLKWTPKPSAKLHAEAVSADRRTMLKYASICSTQKQISNAFLANFNL